MALYTEASVRANLRNREGRRVFYLAPGDHLTPGARDFLRSNHIEILSPEAAKPQVYKTLQGAELACYRAFRDLNGLCTREDLLQGFNRLSSFLWILEIRLASGQEKKG